MKITKQEFQRYEKLRQSGITNMYDLEAVISFTWLPREKVVYIMKNYSKLFKELYQSEDDRLNNRSKGYSI